MASASGNLSDAPRSIQGVIAAIHRLMIANLAQIVAASYGRGSRPGCRGVVVSDFIAAASGTRMATCVGGFLTGRGADVTIIDDPLVRWHDKSAPLRPKADP